MNSPESLPQKASLSDYLAADPVSVRKTHPASATARRSLMSGTSGNGIVRIPVKHSVNESVEKLKDILQNKDVTLFAVIDHSGEAAKAGIEMPNTKLVIFGSPKAGTPVMLAAPSIAIDLPLKILIAEDGAGKVWISYNGAQFLAKRHDVPAELVKVLTAVEGLANAVAS